MVSPLVMNTSRKSTWSTNRLDGREFPDLTYCYIHISFRVIRRDKKIFSLAWYQLLTMRSLTLTLRDFWLRSLETGFSSRVCSPKFIFTDFFKIDFGGSPFPDIVGRLGTTNRNFPVVYESLKLSSFLSPALLSPPRKC